MTKTTTSLPTFTGPLRLWRTRGAAVYLAIVLAFPVLLLFTLQEFAVWKASGNFGITFFCWGPVSTADERWGEVRQHDHVIAINGAPVDDIGHTPTIVGALPPGELRLRFQRGAREWEETASGQPRTRTELAVTYARVGLGIALFLIGAVAFFLRPGVQVSWLFFLFCTALAAYMLDRILLFRAGPINDQIEVIDYLFITGFGLHFFSVFPRTLRFFEGRPRRFALLYAAPIILGVPFIAAFPDPDLAWLWGPLFFALDMCLALSALSLCALLLLQRRQARRNSDYRALVQFRAMFIGLVGGLTLPAVASPTRQYLDLGDQAWLLHLNALPIILFAGMTGYALVRHNALSIDRFTAAVVGYGATLALVGVGLAAVLLGLPLLLGEMGLFQSPVAGAVLATAAFGSFILLYRPLKRRIDRWFARDTTGAGRSTAVLRELTKRIQGADREKSLGAALEAAASLRVDRAELWLLDHHGLTFGRTVARGAPVGEATLPRAGFLGDSMGQTSQGGGVAGLASITLDEAAQVELWARELAVAVPVLAFGVVAGFLGVGRKHSGTAFSEEEHTFIEAIAAQLSLVIERGSAEPTQFGSYRVERRLGVGGMAEVFLSWQLGPGGFERKVALKRLLPHFAEEPEIVSMFLDEARIAAQLSHRHIAQIHEVGHQERAYFIAMEYVDGPSLRQLLRATWQAEQPVPLPIAAAITSATLSALDYAHQAQDARGRGLGVVHRDVTPSNIQLNRQGEVKLLDFGIARAENQLHVTRTGVVKGTLPYMSPEQAAGHPVDRRSDLYSVGAVLYEALSARRAFPDGPSRQRPTPVSSLRQDTSPKLDAWVERALAVHPGERFDSADQMREAIIEALAPTPLATEQELRAWIEATLPRDSGVPPVDTDGEEGSHTTASGRPRSSGDVETTPLDRLGAQRSDRTR